MGKSKSDKDEERGSTAAHVQRVSHMAGGGHHATLAPKASAKAPGIIARAATNPDSWDAGVAIEEDDPMTHPLYQGRKFGDYEFHEFPKWVGDKIANDEAEEKVLLAGRPLIREPEERVRLLLVAETKGVTIDKRWNVEKIAKAIEEAGFDPDFDPTR